MELNRAIVNLLLVQFKNQLENGEVKLIEGEGFNIAKNDGRFVVTTYRDGQYYRREVCIKESYKGYRVIAWNGYTQTEYKFQNVDEIRLKFNFEGFLRAPINKVYAEVKRDEWYYGKTGTQAKAERLRSAKAYIRYAKKDIEETKAKIRKLQEELEDDIRRQVKYEGELVNVRRELGLIK